MDDKNILVELRDVSIQYGTIKALDGINLRIHGGEIHAIVGEHGAGKSTLAKMVANLINPDSGKILYNSVPFDRLSYKDTINAGVRMVFQKMQLNETLSVAENLFIANKAVFQSKGGFFSQKKVERMAETFLNKNNYHLNPHTIVSELELSDRALLSIIKNLYIPPKVLILDEALEKLSALGLERIIQTLNNLRDDGCSILFITHRIDDLYMIADRVSVVRKGEILISNDIRELDKISLIKLAYTQFSILEERSDQAEEFNKLMKYNEVILKQLPISLIVSNFENQIKMINESAKALFKLDQNIDINDLSLDILFANNTTTLQLLAETLAGKEMRSRYNVPLDLKEGTFMVNIIVFPIYDGSLLIGNIFIIEDITEREHLRDQLIIPEKLASLGLLAAGVAHEINNPLGVISNYLESFKQNKIQLEERDSVFAFLFEQINYISQVIGNLITFSESKSQETEIVNIDQAITSIIEMIRFNGEQKHIRIYFNPEMKSTLQVRINRNEFKQVILNLFKNAFEVMPRGGDINIITGRKTFESSAMVFIEFEDNGPGIPFEDPADVFLPFKTSKNTSNNFGLGLSLCYNILNKYHGEISLQSEQKKGCCFQILLPEENL